LEKGILPSPPSLALSSNLVGRPACMPARHCKWLSKTTYEPHVGEGYLAKPFQLGIGSNLVRRPFYGSYIPESIWCKEVHGVLGQLPVLVLACLRANVSFSVALHMNLQARCGIGSSAAGLLVGAALRKSCSGNSSCLCLHAKVLFKQHHR